MKRRIAEAGFGMAVVLAATGCAGGSSASNPEAKAPAGCIAYETLAQYTNLVAEGHIGEVDYSTDGKHLSLTHGVTNVGSQEEGTFVVDYLPAATELKEMWGPYALAIKIGDKALYLTAACDNGPLGSAGDMADHFGSIIVPFPQK